MPITINRGYSHSYEPSYRSSSKKVSFLKAFEMVVDGEVSAMDIFHQLTTEFQKIINDVCQNSFSKDLIDLSNDEQRKIFEMLLGTLKIAEENASQKISRRITEKYTEKKSSKKISDKKVKDINKEPLIQKMEEGERESPKIIKPNKKWWQFGK